MNSFLIGWVAAISSGLIWPELLPALERIILIVAALVLVRRQPLWAGVLMGVCWFSWQASALIDPKQPLQTGRHQVEATLLSLPTRAALYQRTLWQVEQIDGTPLQIQHPNRVSLTHQGPAPWLLGERYRLDVTLRPPSGTLNQFSWNSRRHYLSRRIVATGRIQGFEPLEGSVHWRQHLADKLQQATASLPRGDLIRALAMADRTGLSDQRWRQLRQSGLTHLVAISGLHLTLVAALVVSGLAWASRRLLPSPSGRGRGVILMLAATVVIGYALLAGLGLATQRALIMTLAGMALLATGRQARPWEILLRAMALLLLFDPLAVLAPGYWLSCAAVASILLLLWLKPLGIRSKVATLVWIQCGLTLMLGVVQLGWFGSVTVHALWANLLMVPWVSLLALPLTLAAALWLWLGGPAGDEVLWLADAALWPLDNIATLAASLPGASLGWSLSPVAAALALSASLLLWRRPLPYSGTWALLLLLPLLLSALPTRDAPWRVHVLDVRQGLSVVVERNRRALVFDTGAAYPSGFSYAERVLQPFLLGHSIVAVDHLVLSHGDNDHAGGRRVIQAYWPEVAVIEGAGCLSAPERWQGLSLSWHRQSMAGNNGSCVLVIDDGRHRVMLPGDIEHEAERRMTVAPVDLLVSPHHGSRSSSSPEWLAQVRPRWVVHPSGWRNRWAFPHPEVVARYHNLGAQQWVTGDHGQVSAHFGADGATMMSFREQLAPYWYNHRPW
ncbi:DNA internalization-related competence protein ComEC/Rec2 [Ferrimonas kyonanensis]|uniref:DNA internalization-related competence protein ComEC/Rec2 n=1 Tax=Ferrimonas kyonanensis TaxID=364763 RepID=UPI00146B1D2F|nr:DNA internalization-related competence protein ComEC/Rec2 [Ferrimonas kyonanensis]